MARINRLALRIDYHYSPVACHGRGKILAGVSPPLIAANLELYFGHNPAFMLPAVGDGFSAHAFDFSEVIELFYAIAFGRNHKPHPINGFPLFYSCCKLGS